METQPMREDLNPSPVEQGMTNEEDLDGGDPDALRAFAARLTAQRRGLLCMAADGMCPVAEQYLIIALDHLSQTVAHLELSALAQARAMAEMRTR